jgi:hypothetical protein
MAGTSPHPRALSPRPPRARAIGVDVRALAPPVPDADALFHFKSHPLSDRAVVVPRRGAPRSSS